MAVVDIKQTFEGSKNYPLYIIPRENAILQLNSSTYKFTQ